MKVVTIIDRVDISLIDESVKGSEESPRKETKVSSSEYVSSNLDYGCKLSHKGYCSLKNRLCEVRE